MELLEWQRYRRDRQVAGMPRSRRSWGAYAVSLIPGCSVIGDQPPRPWRRRWCPSWPTPVRRSRSRGGHRALPVLMLVGWACWPGRGPDCRAAAGGSAAAPGCRGRDRASRGPVAAVPRWAHRGRHPSWWLGYPGPLVRRGGRGHAAARGV